MARKKEYIEQVVIEKAMTLFWHKGFENTSMQMLEKEMRINRFSIYSSFGNKNGLFLECIKYYKQLLVEILNKLKTSNNGIIGLKQYFYDYIEFTQVKEIGLSRGCFVINTRDELGTDIDPKIQIEIEKFMQEITTLFINNLKQDADNEIEIIAKQAEYLLMSKVAMVTVSKLFDNRQLKDYIENMFKVF